MSWIKENKFLAGLIGATLLGVAALYFVGAKGAGRYAAAKEEFDAAATDAGGIERLALYPTAENRDGKRKAIDDYRNAAEALQNAFEPFRPKELANVAPQEFTNNLRAVNAEVRQAFEDAGTKVPDAFFCGFENYKTNLARSNATGILNYQLDAIRKLMLALAKSGAGELKNLHRPPLPEENGGAFQPDPADVARRLPLEIAFQGPEKTVRAFLSDLTRPEPPYVVIRSLRILNSKKEPPRAADAKFETPAAATPAADGIFGGGFVLPGEEAKEEGKPAEVAAPPPADSSRILAQVLGNEELQVFLRVDVMQFLPAKKLP